VTGHPAYRKLVGALLCLLVVYVTGVVGYMLLEQCSFSDALYMTVITVATVGYAEVVPLHKEGRLFTMILIIGGMGATLYGLSSLTALIVEGELRSLLRRREMDKKIDKIQDHYILCGTGRTGMHVLNEMIVAKKRVVAIDRDPDQLPQVPKGVTGILTLEGDATKDEVLERAHIERAKGLVAALPTDKDNLYVVISAKGFNPNLRIISKADDEDSRSKLIRAGANSVVLPHAIGGLRMASEMIRPTVVNFLDVMLREKNAALRVEEVAIPAGSSLLGQTLQESRIVQKTGLLVVALRDPDSPGTFRFNPPATTPIRAHEILIVIGNADQILKLRELVTR